MRKDITGIILCGGKSSRMLTNKALLKFKGKTVIEIILYEMKKVFDEVLLSANDCDDYSFLNIPIIEDLHINRGPLSGIYSSLKNSKTSKNFVVTCDVPLISFELIEYISKIDSNKEIIVPTIDGIPQRLFGLYSKSVIDKIEMIFDLIEKDRSIKASVYDLHKRTSVELIEVEQLSFYNKNMFMNMNTQEDYRIIKNIFE